MSSNCSSALSKLEKLLPPLSEPEATTLDRDTFRQPSLPSE